MFGSEVFSTLHVVIFSPFGWVLAFAAISLYLIYSNFIRQHFEEIEKARELEKLKKFDEDVHSRVQERLLAARARQQAEHERVAEELREREEERKRLKQEEMKKKEGEENVLKYSIQSKQVEEMVKKNKHTINAEEFIKSLISSKAVVVFSKSWCPYCRKAREALSTYRLPSDIYEVVELDLRTDLPGDAIQDELQKMTGSRSVPKVFIGGECIGGGDDTVRLHREGLLDALIASVRK